MITIKKLRWSNLFSYGENNEIDFSADALTQIVGKNGHGKSSIALILEEALYNKNSKGIKKADILNRNSNAKSYSIELEFNKDGTDYRIKTTRGNLQTVKLYKEAEDISAHTATNTYKLIEELIGHDHKTFAQIVYQSSAASLEFLTATDSNRKKFLIDLLNLSRYVEAAEVFKSVSKEVSEQATIYTTKATSAEAWLAKYAKTSLVDKSFCVVADTPLELIEEVRLAKEDVTNIEAINKKITQNNKYKELRDAISLEPAGNKPESTKLYSTELIECNSDIKSADSFILKMKKLGTQCATCLQDIDSSKVDAIIAEHTELKSVAKIKAAKLTIMIDQLDTALTVWDSKNTNKELYEEYHGLFNTDMATELLNKEELDKVITTNELTITKIAKAIKDALEHNTTALTHNAKLELIRNQMQEMQDELLLHREELLKISAKLSTLQVLVKTFSSTGLVAYKIECLIKDLEETTNRYLAELSSGRFQISFKIAASDKLNVVITDNGKDIDIIALSGGERARVNAAALLGIRKLMQSLSNSRINLLILDETIENLDVEGKEKLVEVLLAEEHLNTFVISHGFSHPLLEKIQVIKTKNISRIE